MALTVRNDSKHPEGGHVIVEGAEFTDVDALVVESNGQYLAADGRWGREPHSFAVNRVDGGAAGLRLGPNIVDHVAAESRVALRTPAGIELGKLFWVDVVPSRSIATVRKPRVGGTKITPVIVDPPPPPPPPSAPPPSPPLPPPSPPERDRREQNDPSTEAGVERVRVESEVDPGGKDVPWASIAAVAIAVLLIGGLAYRWFAGGSSQTSATLTPAACADRFRDETGRSPSAPSSDADRVKLAETALGLGCGAQAFRVLDQANWQANEAVAWYLARFYDPNETDPVFRTSPLTHPSWAAVYYLKWRSQSPRQSSALTKLCESNRQALEADSNTKRACLR